MKESPLGLRVVALAASIEPATAFESIVRTVRRAFLDELTFETTELATLLRSLREGTGVATSAASLRSELERNVAACEQRRRAGVPIGMARLDALARIHALTERVEAVAALSDERLRARATRRLHHLFGDLGRGAAEADAPKVHVDPAYVRSETELAACQGLVRLALGETGTPARRRRLLDSAKRSMLDLEAGSPIRRDALLPSRHAVVSEIASLDRAIAAGVDPFVSWTHQARAAHARRDAGALVRVLVSMKASTRSANDPRSAQVARALAVLRRDERTDTAKLRREADVRSFGDTYGRRALDSLRQAFVLPPASPPSAGAPAPEPVVDEPRFARTVHTILGVSGSFELGTGDRIALVETLVERSVVVAHPEQTMRIEPARSVADLPNAFIEDPRTSLLDLASGRLLARSYVRVETERVVRPARTAEARFFVLDGSGSMIEPPVAHRGLVRDALVLGELSEIVKREAAGDRNARVVLYYRYFATEPEPIVRIAEGPQAALAMRRIAQDVRSGGTNIEAALVACFDDIRAAVRDDPELVSAQLVLVTDGKAPVSAATLDAARRGIDGIPVRISVIALGEQNPELRRIVATQRAAGEEAFYQFLDDDEMRAIVDTDTSSGAPYLFDPSIVRAFADESNTTMRDEIGGILDELAALDRATEVERLAEARLDAEAFAEAAIELEFLPGPSISGVLAREEHLTRDVRALDLRFTRWFPEVAAAAIVSVRSELDHRAEIVVLAIADVIEVLGGDPFERAASAIALLEGMLDESDLGVFEYGRAIAAPSEPLAAAIERVRGLVRGSDASRREERR